MANKGWANVSLKDGLVARIDAFLARGPADKDGAAGSPRQGKVPTKAQTAVQFGPWVLLFLPLSPSYFCRLSHDRAQHIRLGRPLDLERDAAARAHVRAGQRVGLQQQG